MRTVQWLRFESHRRRKQRKKEQQIEDHERIIQQQELRIIELETRIARLERGAVWHAMNHGL